MSAGHRATDPGAAWQRRVGRYPGDAPGPTVVAVGGLHGNEPAGVIALSRVLDRLHATSPAFRGELVALAGNLAALEHEQRYLDLDLNRAWSPGRIAEIRGRADAGTDLRVEDAEQAELLAALDRILGGAPGDVYFLDLHTSSADGLPFVCIGDTLRNRRFADAFPVPVILGLEEQVDGSLLEYLNNRGVVTVGLEAGHHDLPESVEHHEAFVWEALVSAGCVARADVDRIDELRPVLEGKGRRLPPVMEVRYRHPVRPGDGFRMVPGYRNFQPVQAGELLAHDRGGEIRAPEAGRILLPLYQGLGSDGFFLVREFKPIWLRISELLRRLRVDRIVPLLPGVRRHPEASDVLVVDPRVARWFTVELFHLLGFRKRRSRGRLLTFSRRRFDLAPPPSIRIDS